MHYLNLLIHFELTAEDNGSITDFNYTLLCTWSPQKTF